MYWSASVALSVKYQAIKPFQVRKLVHVEPDFTAPGSRFWKNLKSRNGLKFTTLITMVTIVFSLLKITRGLKIF